MPHSGTELTRAYVATPRGQIHYVECGSGRPVLLIHQTPRSWREYEFVLPLLGASFRAIAMDTVGYGDSYRPERPFSIRRFADGVIQFLDALGIPRASLVGHHTGGVVAVEVAASRPERVDNLVLSCMPYVGPVERLERRSRPPIDLVRPRADGSHLQELWNKRVRYYPPDRPDLIARLVADGMRVLDPIEDGHNAITAYPMEERLSLVQAAVLILEGSADPFSYPDMERLAAALPGCRTYVVEGAGVPLPEQCPAEFARAVVEFLSSATPDHQRAPSGRDPG